MLARMGGGHMPAADRVKCQGRSGLGNCVVKVGGEPPAVANEAIVGQSAIRPEGQRI